MVLYRRGCCPEGGAVQRGDAVQRVVLSGRVMLSITGSDIITPPPPVNRTADRYV